MLVNHLAKRHPDVAPESVPELNLPILRQTRDYYCQYCDKVRHDLSIKSTDLHLFKRLHFMSFPLKGLQKQQ